MLWVPSEQVEAKFQYILCIGFTNTVTGKADKTYVFQYILCIGFTVKATLVCCIFEYFNTSYVSVLLTIPFKIPISCLRFQYILCIGFTVMQNYNVLKIAIFQYILCIGFTGAANTKQMVEKLFQYILCIGFTLFVFQEFQLIYHFNTSYVSVLLYLII